MPKFCHLEPEVLGRYHACPNRGTPGRSLLLGTPADKYPPTTNKIKHVEVDNQTVFSIIIGIFCYGRSVLVYNHAIVKI